MFPFRYEYLFNFDNTFEIHDDIEVLKRMGMAYSLEKGQCSAQDLNKAVRMVPDTLKPYVLGEFSAPRPPHLPAKPCRTSLICEALRVSWLHCL